MSQRGLFTTKPREGAVMRNWIVASVYLLVAGLSAPAATNYVALSGSGGPGDNWGNAYTNLNDAAANSVNGDVILIKTGTYAQAAEVYIGPGTNLTIRGGYAGSGTPGSRSASPATPPTPPSA